MVRDAIFYALPAAALAETSRYLSFNTIVSTTPTTWFCNLDPAAQAAWLDKNREKLEDEFAVLEVGRSVQQERMAKSFAT